MTPTWANPRAAPPPRASAMRGLALDADSGAGRMPVQPAMSANTNREYLANRMGPI